MAEQNAAHELPLTGALPYREEGQELYQYSTRTVSAAGRHCGNKRIILDGPNPPSGTCPCGVYGDAVNPPASGEGDVDHDKQSEDHLNKNTFLGEASDKRPQEQAPSDQQTSSQSRSTVRRSSKWMILYDDTMPKSAGTRGIRRAHRNPFRGQIICRSELFLIIKQISNITSLTIDSSILSTSTGITQHTRTRLRYSKTPHKHIKRKQSNDHKT